MTIPWTGGRADLAVLRDVESRAITAENPTGERGAGGRATEGTGARAARDLGVGWKVAPSIQVPAGAVVELGRIEGSGTVQHIWCTTRVDAWRSLVLRMSWDGADGEPAVEAPLGDFFCQAWTEYAPVTSELVVVAPHGGLNTYFPMPFRSGARLAVENLGAEDVPLYYQIDYTLGEVPETAGYLHASWRRSNPVAAGDVHTILDAAPGRGRYVGTFLAVGVTYPGWWGEGEVKFHLDGEEHPTICGTGTEDYFGGAWNFDVPGRGYTAFSAPYCGLHQVVAPDGLYRAQTRFGMYRWHVPDPVRFESDLRATVQALGWRSGGRYLPLRDDIASTAYWYQAEPHAPYPALPGRDALEVT